MNTKEKLDLLAELQAQEDSIRLTYQDMKHNILTPEQIRDLADIDAEMNTSLASLKVGIDDLMNQIKNEVILAGKTVDGEHIKAVWNKGRVSWDTKGLDGYAVAHPEISAFRSIGEPSVTIRKV